MGWAKRGAMIFLSLFLVLGLRERPSREEGWIGF
jgi:hypothetical protein